MVPARVIKLSMPIIMILIISSSSSSRSNRAGII